MKRMLNIEKDFNADCEVYDINTKDNFGNKFYVVANKMTDSIRFYGKYNDYSARRKKLDTAGLRHVIIQKYGEIINVSQKTLDKISAKFPEYKMPTNLVIGEDTK